MKKSIKYIFNSYQLHAFVTAFVLVFPIIEVLGQSSASEFCLNPSEVIIHPNASDFTNTEDVGKILISDSKKDFYTSYQSSDRQVIISVVLPQEYKGEMVYFLLVDPDDPSDYDQDTEGDDNLCSGASLQFSQGRAFTIDLFGIYHPIVVNRLTITDKCSGDNYKIICSLEPLDPSTGKFPASAQTFESIIYTAWKRLYYTNSEMYKNGTYTLGREVGEETFNGIVCKGILVKEADNFHVGDEVVYFDRNGINLNLSNIIQISLSKDVIYVPLFPNPIDMFGGLRKIQDVEKVSFTADTDLIEKAYSKDCNGNSGETFTEIIYDGKNPIPVAYNTYYQTDMLGSMEFTGFFNYWTNGPVRNNNEIVAFSALNVDPSLYGLCPKEFTNENLVLVYNIENPNILPAYWDDSMQETLVHEIGHVFKVISSHIDKPYPVASVRCANDINCQMNRPTDISYRWDRKVRFDEDSEGCIYDIRKASNPR